MRRRIRMQAPWRSSCWMWWLHCSLLCRMQERTIWQRLHLPASTEESKALSEMQWSESCSSSPSCSTRKYSQDVCNQRSCETWKMLRSFWTRFSEPCFSLSWIFPWSLSLLCGKVRWYFCFSLWSYPLQSWQCGHLKSLFGRKTRNFEARWKTRRVQLPKCLKWFRWRGHMVCRKWKSARWIPTWTGS